MNTKMMTVVKKEFSRFFGDKRMVFSTLILPALMIYLLYSFMGDGLMDQFTVADDYVSNIYVWNMPQSMEPIFKEMSVKVMTDKDNIEDMKDAVRNKDADMVAVFPENFDNAVATFDQTTATQPAPKVELYYNSAKTESDSIHSMMEQILEQYETSLCNKFDVNPEEGGYDLASDKDTTGMVFSMMLPMLLMIFIFSGCMSIAPESIAGEKERGTIAKLLVSPTQRSSIALGKIFSLSVLGLLCGTSSFVGTILSMPKLVQQEGMSASVYKVNDYVLLLLVIFSTVFVIVGLLSIISAFAKTVKEASTYVMPLMVVVMLISVTSMFGAGAPNSRILYAIPLYNSVQCMNAIFGFQYNMVNILITVVVNLGVTAVLTFILTKMFNSEKVMFS